MFLTHSANDPPQSNLYHWGKPKLSSACTSNLRLGAGERSLPAHHKPVRCRCVPCWTWCVQLDLPKTAPNQFLPGLSPPGPSTAPTTPVSCLARSCPPPPCVMRWASPPGGFAVCVKLLRKNKTNSKSSFPGAFLTQPSTAAADPRWGVGTPPPHHPSSASMPSLLRISRAARFRAECLSMVLPLNQLVVSNIYSDLHT